MQTTAIPMPSPREASYLAVFKCAAVAISARPSGAIVIAAVRDIATAPKVPVAVWWVADIGAAEALASQASDVDLRGRRARTIDEAVIAIRTAARRMDVRLSEHAAVLQRAKAATARIAENVEAAARRGDLRFFNVMFQQQRKVAALEGRKLDYTACRQRFEAALAYVAAGRMAGDPGVTLDVVAMTFGSRETGSA